MHSEKDIQEHVDVLQSLNDTTEFQKRCFSQISFAVNLSDTCLDKHFKHEVKTVEDTGWHYAKIKLKNKTGSTFHQDFWHVIFNVQSPSGENRTKYNCWSLHKPWKQSEMLDFSFRIRPLHHGPLTVSCSLLFVVPSSYVSSGGGAASNPTARTSAPDAVSDITSERTAVLTLPLFSSTLNALHALEPSAAVSAAPALAVVPRWATALLPPAAEPVPSPPLELGVSVLQLTTATGWLSAALHDSTCRPTETDPLTATGRLWGCPVRLTASEPAGAVLLTASCPRLTPLLRLLRALRRRLPEQQAVDTVRVPSHVLTRLHGLLERVQTWSGDPSRLLELWLAAHQSVSHRLPHV